MKLFVISDTHGSLSAFKKALEAFEKEQADFIIHCGDYLNHGPRNPLPQGYNTKALAEKLNDYKEKIISVRGNCDSEVDQMLLQFPCLESFNRLFFSTNSEPYCCFIHHGHLFTQETLPKSTYKTVYISGHTHVPLLEQKEKTVFLNPGSVALPKQESQPSYGIIEQKENQLVISLKTLEGITYKSLVF
ncbi:MAG: phosphodiesterase [Spirochaetaceae bacterium]|nr:phosphodiesterase [Spirochaetaceae bacterium]